MTDYVEAHKKRLEWMPWLFFSLKEQHRKWAQPWQDEIQNRLTSTETVRIGKNCFVAASAAVFAEPGRPVVIGDSVTLAADVFLHGPVEIGNRVSINARASLDGGAKGIRIGDDTRIATGCAIYAFNHGMDPERTIASQPVTSLGVEIGRDVWIGANVCIRDGVKIGDKAVVGMGSVVTKNVEAGTIVAGNPARKIGTRVHEAQ